MSKTLLLADDSVTIQKIVGLTFANEDIRLVTVDNGDDALIRARALLPDLILADITMPGLSGYELCAAVRDDAELSGTPVLLLTGAFETLDESLAEASGSSDFIAKPFEAQALVNKVEALLARGRRAEPDAPAALSGETLGQSGAEPAALALESTDTQIGEETLLYQEPVVTATPEGPDVSDPSWDSGPVIAGTSPTGEMAPSDEDLFPLELLQADAGPVPDASGESGSNAFDDLPFSELSEEPASLGDSARGQTHTRGGTTDQDLSLRETFPSLDETRAVLGPERVGDRTLRVGDPVQNDDPLAPPGWDWEARSAGSPGTPSSGIPGDPASAEMPREGSHGAPSAAEPGQLPQELSQVVEKIAWDAFGPLSEQIVSQVIRKVEEIAWEAVPQIAERLVRDEIERLKADKDSKG